MDYKKLLKSVQPKLNFSFSNVVLMYEVDYIDVKEHDKSNTYHKCTVNFKRLSGDQKYSVANKVLLGVLHNEIREINKYMGEIYFSFDVNEDLDLCK